MSQTVTMEVTGHLTPSVFQRYNIPDDADKRAAIGKLSAELNRSIEDESKAKNGTATAQSTSGLPVLSPQ